MKAAYRWVDHNLNGRLLCRGADRNPLRPIFGESCLQHRSEYQSRKESSIEEKAFSLKPYVHHLWFYISSESPNTNLKLRII